MNYSRVEIVFYVIFSTYDHLEKWFHLHSLHDFLQNVQLHIVLRFIIITVFWPSKKTFMVKFYFILPTNIDKKNSYFAEN